MLRVAGPAAVLVLGLAGGLVVNANSSRIPAAASFPPAVPAGQDFAPYQPGSTRGIVLSEGRVASAGAEIVAVGAESGQVVPRAQFFVSPDGGRTWSLGGVATADGGTPPPGHAARFVAGGAGAWAAIGSDSVWTSTDGRAWTLASATGLPQQPGDDVTVLKRTGGGFLAAGANRPDGDRSTPVIFLSADGRRWTRLGGGQLRLAAGGGQVQDIRLAAASGNRILIAGDVAAGAAPAGPGRIGAGGTTGAGRTGAAWLSDDGGRSWRPVTVPAGPGASAEFSDMAATANGFLLVRPAMVDGRAAADVYRSGNGTDWTFAATLTTPAGFSPGLMNGGAAGAVLAGRAGPALTAFTSADGVRWRQVPAFGRAPAEAVSGVAVTAGGAVIAAGSSQSGRQRLITIGRGAGTAGLADPAGVSTVSLSAIPGGVEPQVAVDAITATGPQGRQQVAVGSANGFPAAWASADGGRTWRRGAGQTAAVLNRPGIQQLTSVTHGPFGWLAVGGAIGASGAAGASGMTSASGMTADGFVAVGSDGQRPATWTTPDGRAWRLADVPLPAGATAAELQQVASTGRTVVATGMARTAAGTLPFAAHSADGGRSWTAVFLPVPAGTAQLSAVAAAGSGFTVTGTFGATAGDRDVVVWTSRDGVTWKAATPTGPGLAAPGIQAITGLTVSGHTLTGVGFTATPSGEQPTLWQPPIR
jgi:hypothetical protein